MDYECDGEKNLLNIAKHGLSFEDAYLVFAGPCMSFEDTRYDYGEDRFITLGLLENNTVVVVHTERGDNVRIISMRKATKRERKVYEQGDKYE